MKRILIATATGVSLIACVVCLWFWGMLCSGGAFDRKGYRSPGWLEANLFGVPLWAIAVVAGLLPMYRLGVAIWRANSLPEEVRNWGRCAGCGYDLRATPERCPECGLVVEVNPPAAERVGWLDAIWIAVFVGLLAVGVVVWGVMRLLNLYS